ncbi:thioesterase II family protein [Streptomyces sp. NPDC050255]
MTSERGTEVRPALHLRDFGSVRDPEVLLYCFPYAGGNAAFYRPWMALLPQNIGLRAVQLPARQDLLDVPPFTAMTDLVTAAAQLVREDAQGRRHVFLGHSMGALVAFETARELRRQEQQLPEHLVLSGHGAPHLARRHPVVDGLDDGQLLATVGRLGGIPEQVATTADLLPLIIPAIRADFSLLAAYRHTQEPPLDCGAFVVGGAADEMVPSEALAAWNSHFTGPVSVEQYPGGHFYLSKWGSRILSHTLDHIQRT